MIHDGQIVTLVWDQALVPPTARVTQVAGMCFIDSGEILLVSAGDGQWGLPGGHPEPGESWSATLRREVHEEACATVRDEVYLGALRVASPNAAPQYQLRYWARVELRVFAPEHEMTARALVLPTEFALRLAWGKSPIASELLTVALEVERQHRSRAV
jgi:ADP-ribose pyrophosphatase YjhB (NUDIX family)